MKRLFIAASGLGIVVVLWMAFDSAGPDRPSLPHSAELPKSAPAASSLEPASPSKPAVSGLASLGTPQEGPSVPPLPMDASTEAVLDSIQAAATTYDAKELPRIQPFLLHPEPTVRTAALEGIVVLGHPAGGAILREASRLAPTPKEARDMLTAADYVELPSASMAPAMKRNAKSGNKPAKTANP